VESCRWMTHFVRGCKRRATHAVSYHCAFGANKNLRQGFDIIGSGRHKIETPDQFASSLRVSAPVVGSTPPLPLLCQML
jgi:hypothetical protein